MKFVPKLFEMDTIKLSLKLLLFKQIIFVSLIIFIGFEIISPILHFVVFGKKFSP